MIARSRNRVARLMRLEGLQARRKWRFRTTTDSRHNLPIAANELSRHFEVSAPNVAWVTDITYVWTREGWLYLAALLDLFSRRVVGWATSDSLSRQLALDALAMALGARRPPEGLIHHSDRGSQYASDDYREALAEVGIRRSMSRKGDCWDNAVAESFSSTIKAGLVHDADFLDRDSATAAIDEYIHAKGERPVGRRPEPRAGRRTAESRASATGRRGGLGPRREPSRSGRRRACSPSGWPRTSGSRWVPPSLPCA